MVDEVSAMLAPVVALVIWTLILQLWNNSKRDGTRLVGRDRKAGTVGGVVGDYAGDNAHNADYLIEQPTLFYAIAISMALLHTHGGSATNLVLAWAYVCFKVAHSVVQLTSDAILYRFLLFNLASFALLGLAIHAAIHAF